jgi:hypothetical protein
MNHVCVCRSTTVAYCFSPFFIECKHVLFAATIIAHFGNASSMSEHAAICHRTQHRCSYISTVVNACTHRFETIHTRTFMCMTRPNKTSTMITKYGLQRERLLFEMMCNIDFQLVQTIYNRINGKHQIKSLHLDISFLYTDKHIDCNMLYVRHNGIVDIESRDR